MQLTYKQGLYGALAELAQRPQYIQPLREEIESALTEWGVSVAGCDRMILLDSFLKECQRLHPPAAGMSIWPAPRGSVSSLTWLQCLLTECACQR